MPNIFEMTDTWNEGATTFSAIKMDVTDTASGAASLLLDLQVGGSSKFSVSKQGSVKASSFSPSDSISDIANRFNIRGADIKVASNGLFGFSSGASNSNGNADTYISRDAAGAIGQRNGINPQAYRVYNSYTDAANYERGGLVWTSNELQLMPEAAGTGAARDLRIGGHMNNGGDTAGRRTYLGSVAYLSEGGGWLNFSGASNGFAFHKGVYFSHSTVLMPALPTTDPLQAGRLWNSAGTLKISAGA